MKKHFLCLSIILFTVLLIGSTRVHGQQAMPPILGSFSPATEITLHSSVIAANGNPIIIKAATKDKNRVNLYYDLGQVGVFEDDVDKPIDLKALGLPVVGSLSGGFDLSATTIIGGSYNKTITGSTCITMLGGIVNDIYGGGYSTGTKADVNGDTNVYIIGESYVASIFGGGGGKKNVSNNTSVLGTANVYIDTLSSEQIKSVFGGSYSNTGASKDTVVTIKNGNIDSVYGGGTVESRGSHNIRNTSISILGGNIENIFGASLIGTDANSTATAENTFIRIEGGTINGSVAAGGNAPASNFQMRRCGVTGNAEITVSGGTFTGRGQSPEIIGGSLADGNCNGRIDGIAKIFISGGSFPRIGQDKPVISGGGSNLTGSLTGDLGTGKSEIYISGGIFNAPIFLDGWTKTTPAISSSTLLNLSGGTINKPISSTQSKVDGIYINGGSLAGNLTGVTPTISIQDSTSLYKASPIIKSSAGVVLKNAPIESIKTQPNISYNLNDVTTNSDGKVNLYLPADVAITELTSGGKRYTGSLTVASDDSATGVFTPAIATPITGVTLLPNSIAANTETLLTASLQPQNASFDQITLSIAGDGGTNSTLSQNKLFAKNPGTVTVLVTVTSMDFPPYSQEVDISVKGNGVTQEQDGEYLNIYANGNPILVTDKNTGCNLYYDTGNSPGVLDSEDVLIDLINPDSKINLFGRSKDGNLDSPITVLGGVLGSITGNSITVHGGIIEGVVFATGSATVQITGGTLLSKLEFESADLSKLYISGGNVKNKHMTKVVVPPTVSPTDSTPVFPTIFTMNCTPGDKITALTTEPLLNYGLSDVYADDDCSFTAYLPQNTKTTEIYAGGKLYVNSEGIITGAGLNTGSLIHKNFVPVTSITLSSRETTVGTPLTLNSKVEPEDANKKEIIWKLLDVGTTGASLQDNQIVATYAGTVTLQGRIIDGKGNGLDYFENFYITINPLQYGLSLSAYGIDFGNLPPSYPGISQSVKATNTGTQPFSLTSEPSQYCNVSLPTDPIAPGKQGSIMISPKKNLPTGTYNETITIKGKSAVATIQVQFNIHYYLESVPAPQPITGIAAGAPKTAEGLGLPTSLPVISSGVSQYLSVIWNVDGCNYDPSSLAFQDFIVEGEVQLPPEIENPSGLQTKVKISVSLFCLLKDNGVEIIGKLTEFPSLLAPSISAGDPTFEKLAKNVNETMEIISAYNLIFTGKSNESTELFLPANSKHSGLSATIYQLLPSGKVISHPVTMGNDGARIMIDAISPVLLATTKQQTDSISTPEALNKAIKKAGSVPTIITLDKDIHYTKSNPPFTLAKNSHITLVGAALHLEAQTTEVPKDSYLSLLGLSQLIITDSKVTNNGTLLLDDTPILLNDSQLISTKSLTISKATLTGNTSQLSITGGSASFNASTFTGFTGESGIFASYADKLSLDTVNFSDSDFSLGLSQVKSVQISGCNFMNLTSKNQGVIYCKDSDMEIKNTVFNTCHASSGGAIYLAGTSTALVDNGRFENCSSDDTSGAGGAICTGDNSHMTIKNSVFIRCKSAYGGAIAITQNSKAQISNTELSHNTGISGGAIALGSSVQTTDSLMLSSTWIHDNGAKYGGGIFIDDCVNLRLEDAVIFANKNSGIFFGDSGYGALYDKIALFDNYNQSSNEDIYVTPTPSGSSKTFSVSANMLGNGKHNWSQPEDVHTDNPCAETLSMFSSPTNEDKALAQLAATVRIEANQADFGGGIASNGVLLSGVSTKSKALLKKIDAGTGLPLAGAIFALYSKEDEKIGEYTTDQNGEIYNDTLAQKASYYFVELQAPPGYLIDENNNKYPFIYGDKTVFATNMPVVPKLTISKNIRKTDMLNKEITPNSSSKFAFTFEINDGGTYEYVINGLTNTISSGEEFYLRDGESATFIDLPANVQYTITEQNYYDQPIDGNHYISYGKNTSGTIPQGGYLQASFENVLVPQELLDEYTGVGSLAVVSRIKADDRDVDKSKFFETTAIVGKNPDATFSYQIVKEPYYSLGDPLGESTTAVSSPIPDIPMYKSNGNVITAQLCHKSALIIYDIPVGSEYTVSQIDYTHMDGYSIVTNYNTAGVILPDKLDSDGKVFSRARTDFINHYTRPVTFQINVTKRWAQKEQLPNELLVDFSADQAFSSLTLTAENQWKDKVEVEKPQYQSLDYNLQGKNTDGYDWELVFDDSSINGGSITHNWELKEVSESQSTPEQDSADHNTNKRVITTTTEEQPQEDSEVYIPWDGKRIVSFGPPKEANLYSDNLLSNKINTTVFWIWAQFASTAMIVVIACSTDKKKQ